MAQATTEEILETARKATDTATVSRVFGTPIEKDGVLLLPVARVAGGAGGGGGGGDSADGTTQGSGNGVGYGLSAKPAGVFVLKEGEVTWKPALDVNKIILGGQLVAIAAFLVARSVLRRRSR
ncbi:spore germination protein GerW family protein [Actinoplanes sp. NPDC051851]|uniref:spore germination protein GerW family protein n=1 Tax=Actinoplanes sp. NPDC051851 TaxID=3154753 RepID=UPI003435F235